MPPSCNCIAGAFNSLRAAPALRGPLRTSARRSFASTHSSTSPILSRTAAAQNTSCQLGRRGQAQGAGYVAGRSRGQIRAFSSSTPRSALKTIEQVRARNKGGVCCILLPIISFRGIILQFPAVTNAYNHSPSTSRPPSSSSAPPRGCMHTLRMRKSAWRGRG